MKILAGRFGGRKIKTSKKLPYRPTKSIVRKSLFDLLRPFNYQTVLDLFSGSGAFGFESGSRGSHSITFVENNKIASNYLKQNAKLLYGPKYNFYELDVFKYLIKEQESFDLIFADPPYYKYDIEKLIDLVLTHLNEKGKFILECDKKQDPFLGAVSRDYGQTRI